MAKRGGFPGGMGGFGGMNMGNIMKQAKKMQADMEKSQEELAQKEFEATAGGGAVMVKVSGDKLVKEVKQQKEVVDPDDVEMLEDLILTCVNEALRKVDEAQAAQFGKFNIFGQQGHSILSGKESFYILIWIKNIKKYSIIFNFNFELQSRNIN